MSKHSSFFSSYFWQILPVAALIVYTIWTDDSTSTSPYRWQTCLMVVGLVWMVAFSRLGHRLNELKEEVVNTAEEADRLRERLQELESKLTEVESNLTEVGSKVTDVEDATESLRSDVEDLQAR